MTHITSKQSIATILILLMGAVARGASGNQERTESVTHWTDRGELFMEYAYPMVGKSIKFLAHLTELENFRAVSKAKVTIIFKKGELTVTGEADRPARPGIFLPTVTFTQAGDYEGELIVQGEDLEETFSLETVQVIDQDGTPPPEEGEPLLGEEVPFLKEQQWKIPFRTVIAARRRLVSSIRILGEVIDKPGHSVNVSSPIEGRVVREPPVIGTRVSVGELLLEVAPFQGTDLDQPHLKREELEARAELDKATVDLARIEGLVAKGAMPAKELSAAKTQVAIATAKLEAALVHRESYNASQQSGPSRLSPSQHFSISAPISGDVTKVLISQGQLVSRGDPLFEIDDLSKVWIQAQVFEPDLPRARKATGAVLTFPGFSKPFSLDELSGKIILVGHHVSAESRTAPVTLEISNPDDAFPIGGFVEVDLLTSETGSFLAVPVEALMEDGDHRVVFVQRSGETFEKREVTTGIKDRGFVSITTGLKPGDRVVTVGAYAMKLSTIGGAIPAHGHAH